MKVRYILDVEASDGKVRFTVNRSMPALPRVGDRIVFHGMKGGEIQTVVKESWFEHYAHPMTRKQSTIMVAVLTGFPCSEPADILFQTLSPDACIEPFGRAPLSDEEIAP